MARYSSSRSNKALKAGALLITLVGAFSFTGVVHALDHAGHAMAHDPIATVVLAVGVCLVLYAFRDSLLAPLGWMTPQRAERLIKAWLETQSYSVKRERKPPDFVLIAEDTQGRKFGLTWVKEPYIGVIIGTTWGIGDQLAPIWCTATPADLRQLQLRLVEIGTRLEGGGAAIQNLEDAATAQVFFGSELPRDLLTYEDFYRRLQAVEGCLMVAINLTNDLTETLKERQAPPVPQALPPAQA